MQRMDILMVLNTTPNVFNWLTATAGTENSGGTSDNWAHLYIDDPHGNMVTAGVNGLCHGGTMSLHQARSCNNTVITTQSLVVTQSLITLYHYL